MPRVVDADEDADRVGAQIEAVLFPPGVEIDDAIAADRAVDELDVVALRVVAEDARFQQPRITGSDAVRLVSPTQ